MRDEIRNSKKAILFAGQGAQYINMGKDLYDNFDYVRTMYDEASKILGYDIKEICFKENDLINKTMYTQPAVLVTSCAIFEVLKREFNLQKPVCLAGFSLGEYSALYAAGIFDFNTIVYLIKYRAMYMDEAANKTQGSMAAIIGMNRDTLENLCKEIGNVQIANYNCPNQLVVGGEVSAVEKLCEKAKLLGAKRAIKLNVSGGFHTPLMSSAAEKMYSLIKNTVYQKPNVDVIMNCNAEVLDFDELPDLMKKQIESSVYFEDTIRKMINDYSVETFIEIGPGKVLSGFLKKIDATQTIISLDNINDFDLLK